MMRDNVAVEIVFGGHSIRAEIPLSELGNPSPENLEEEVSRYVLENISVWVETDEDSNGADEGSHYAFDDRNADVVNPDHYEELMDPDRWS